MSIVQRIDIDTLEQKDEPLWHHKANRSQTASGYGNKLSTRMMVRLPGSPRWRRVYYCIHSNIGTRYVTAPCGGWIVLT